MSETNTWYQDIETKISFLKEKMVGERSNINQLDKILAVAKKIEKHSPKCSECSGFQDDISNVVNDLKEWPDTTDEQNENYLRTLKEVTRHLDKYWYQNIETKISSLKGRMAADRPNLKQLDLLLKLSQRIKASSSGCSECSALQKQITEVVNDLSDWPDVTDEHNEYYVRTLEKVTKHTKHLDKHGTAKFGSRGGCLILLASWIGGAVLLFLGVRQAAPILFGPEDWSHFWFWGVPSIILFITGIVFLVIGFRNSYRHG